MTKYIQVSSIDYRRPRAGRGRARCEREPMGRPGFLGFRSFRNHNDRDPVTVEAEAEAEQKLFGARATCEISS